MKGTSTLFPYGQPRAAPPRSVRDLVAVAYRQAGLIVLCTLIGCGVSWMRYVRQPSIYISGDQVQAETDTQVSLRQASQDPSDATNRIAALTARNVGGARNGDTDGGLKLDLNPEVNTGTGTGTDKSATPTVVAMKSQTLRPALESRLPLPLELPLRLQIEEEPRDYTDDAPDRPPAAETRKKIVGAAFGPIGPIGGLILGLLLAALREFGGERMRSPREAEWALGVPVLGTIPTLSAKVRDAYLFAHAGASTFAPTELA